MDYEKAYKEALERAKHGLPIDEIFPELNESEEERIRKELLEVIKHCYEDGGYALCTDDYKKYSAYLEKQKEQKPAEWSEEDEKNINGISMVLESWDRYHVSPSGLPSLIPGYISWLKSLRPQPEQKRHLNMKDQWCCNAARAAVRDSDVYDGEEKQFILAFLQRCKPQPHWKPSDEQIDALEAVLGMIHPTDTRYDAVFGLLEELKAL